MSDLDEVLANPHLIWRTTKESVKFLGTLAAIDLENQRPLNSAAVWEHYSDGKAPRLLGFTDSSGSIQINSNSGQVRVLKPGYIPIDIPNLNGQGGHTTFGQRLHPAAYSGFLPNADSAIWVKRGSDGPAFEFTALGLMREAHTLATLHEAEFLLYSLRKKQIWNPSFDPIGFKSTWCSLANKSTTYPANGRWTIRLNSLNQFRFPGPGRMIVRDEARKNDEMEFELVN